MKPIKFADKKGYLIQQYELKQLLTSSLHDIGYPKCLETKVSLLNDDSIHQLKEIQHLITTNYCGKPYLLYLTELNCKKYCVFCDLNQDQIQYIMIKFRFDSKLYKGTLFLGEFMYDENKKSVFYIKDIFCYKGKTVQNKLSERLSMIYEILRTEYLYDDYMNVSQLRLKSYFLYSNLKKVKDVNKAKILYFVPETKDYPVLEFNVDHKAKRQQVIKEKTKMFEIKKGDDVDIYYLFDKKIKIGIAAVTSLRVSNFCKSLFLNPSDKIMVKCKFNDNFNKWVPCEKV